MVRPHPPVGEQLAGSLAADGNVQQTVSMKVAEFAPALLDEFNSAKPMNFQANPGQAQGFHFQGFHRRQTRPAKHARAHLQERVE